MPQSLTNALRDAVVSLQGDLELVRRAFLAADAATACLDPHVNNREWCAVYLNDAWHRFCRRLVIASAFLEPKTLSGVIVPRAGGLTSQSDVLARLRQLPGRPVPGWWEPRWHDALDASRAARFLKVANASQIVAALGSTPSPATELNTVRNFIAHRNGDTAGKLRVVLTKYAVVGGVGAPSRAVVDALLSQTSGTQPRFIDWCHQIEQIAYASAN